MKLPCIRCGRVDPPTCQRKDCPYFATSKKKPLKKDFSGQAPNLFVGRYGYPDVRVGLLATEEYDKHDDPKAWTREQTPIPDIMDLRSSLVNSQFTANVKSAKNKFLESAQLIAQGGKPTDMEVNLDRTPSFQTRFPPGASPHGASVNLVNASITQNVRIPRAVDKTVNDELKAADQLTKLADDIDEHHLTKLLTSGVLGTDERKKLVPTRWSITAVDDTLGKDKISKVKDLPVLGQPRAYFGGHYGNFFCVLLFAHHWQYELFEFMSGTRAGMQPMTDYEPFSGRTSYAENCAGGYYAARVPVLEKLLSLKRQASALVVRWITDEYTNPLGVWVMREAVRKALKSKPLRFSSADLMKQYLAKRNEQFGIEASYVEQHSKLLRGLGQKSLTDY